MNILLNIPEDVVEKYQESANNEKRSRKNLMEKVLIDFFTSPKPLSTPQEPKKQFQEQYPPQKIDQFQAYKDDIKQTTYSGDLQKIMKTVNGDSNLIGWQKKQLETIATDHAKTFI